MFDFGDELIIGSDRIPWLLWIQLLVMLLLLLLLYYISIFALGIDFSITTASASAAAPPSSSAPLPSNSQPSKQRPLSSSSTTASGSSPLRNPKVGESHGVKGDTGTSTSKRRSRREDVPEREREGSASAKDATHSSVLERSYHPCHYLGLAKQAFLKCLGLDLPSKDSPNSRHTKEQ